MHPYKRTDGTPVSKHTRRPPGVAQKEQERAEKKQAFFKEKQAQKEKAKRERSEGGGGGGGAKAPPKKKAVGFASTSSEHKDEGDWEENDDENELGDGDDGEEQQQQQEGEEGAEEYGEEEGAEQQQEGEGGEDGSAAPPAQQQQKMRAISLDEFLNMPWNAQQQILVDKKLDQGGQKDPVARSLVVKDAIAAAEKQGAAAFQDDDEGRILGYDDFLKAFDKAGNFNNPDRAAVSRHLRSGKYNDGGAFGKTCLVPHLYGAGMFELAKAVQVGKYKF